MPLPPAAYELPSALRWQYGYHYKQSLNASFTELYEADQGFALGYLCGPARTTEERIRLTQEMANYSANVEQRQCKMDEPDGDFMFLIDHMSPEGASDPAYSAAFLMAIHQNNVFPHDDQAPLVKYVLMETFALSDNIIEKSITDYIDNYDATLIQNLASNPMLNQKQKERLNSFVAGTIFGHDDGLSEVQRMANASEWFKRTTEHVIKEKEAGIDGAAIKSMVSLLAWIKSEHCSKELIEDCVQFCMQYDTEDEPLLEDGIVFLYEAIRDSIQCDAEAYNSLPNLEINTSTESAYFKLKIYNHMVKADNEKKLLRCFDILSIDPMDFIARKIESGDLTYRQTKLIYEVTKNLEDKNLVAEILWAMNQFTEQTKTSVPTELMAAYSEIVDATKGDGCHWVENNINLATKYVIIGLQTCMTHSSFNEYYIDTQAKMKAYINFIDALQSIGVKWTEDVDFYQHKTNLIEVLESDCRNVDALEIATSIRLKEKLNQMLPNSLALKSKRTTGL